MTDKVRMMEKRKLFWGLLVMLAVMAGITGAVILLLYWVEGMWVPWGSALMFYGILCLVGLILLFWIYWMDWRYE